MAISNLGASQEVDQLLHDNEDPFNTTTLPTDSSVGGTGNFSMPTNFPDQTMYRTTQESTKFPQSNVGSAHTDPFDPFIGMNDRDPLMGQSVAERSTFQVLSKAAENSTCTALVPFPNVDGQSNAATAMSWNPVPVKRTMPGEYYEESDGLGPSKPREEKSSPRSPRHHMNAETELLMAELEIGANETDIFSYIVEVALRSDLPPPWKKKLDQDGATYYVDVDNETTTWTSPLLSHLKDVVQIGRMYLKKPSAKYFEESKSTLWLSHIKELESWHGPLKDDEGNSYFWNSESMRSSWHDPRLGAQFVFDLQCSLLKHLETSFTAAQDTDEDPFDAHGAPPWETKPIIVEDGMMAIQKVPEKPLGEKAQRVNDTLQASFNHKEQSFVMHQMSNTADWVRGAVNAEEDVQRRRLTQKRVQMLEDKKQRDRGRDLAETIHNPMANVPVFLGTAPLELREPWVHATTPLDYTKPWLLAQPRCHVGWQPWELWTKGPEELRIIAAASHDEV